MAVVDGEPEIVGGGGALGGAETVMVNGLSDALAKPSLTLITMFGKLPIFAVVGVPASWPVAVLKLAHAGSPEIAKVSVCPLGPLAVGVKLYATPATSVVAAVPEIVGRYLQWPALAKLLPMSIAKQMHMASSCVRA